MFQQIPTNQMFGCRITALQGGAVILAKINSSVISNKVILKSNVLLPNESN